MPLYQADWITVMHFSLVPGKIPQRDCRTKRRIHITTTTMQTTVMLKLLKLTWWFYIISACARNKTKKWFKQYVVVHIWSTDLKYTVNVVVQCVLFLSQNSEF